LPRKVPHGAVVVVGVAAGVLVAVGAGIDVAVGVGVSVDLRVGEGVEIGVGASDGATPPEVFTRWMKVVGPSAEAYTVLVSWESRHVARIVPSISGGMGLRLGPK
jgi:hypothetical protein